MYYDPNAQAYYGGQAVAQDAYHRNSGQSGAINRSYQVQGVNGFETGVGRVMQELVRPRRYRHSRPSFYSAYARACHRYEFESGKYAGFAKRNGAVVKTVGLYNKNAHHEVPAESVHNALSSFDPAGQDFISLFRSSEYVVQVTVGTPGLVVNLDFDTGSSDLWIWSSELAEATPVGLCGTSHTETAPQRMAMYTWTRSTLQA
ncbi:hypothetical protein NM688_g9309 [Phlebia brevispora]|uniref:Uncharacterized protein n=1 Tax=Phlebia brevispora TaxID=194682 RepID=A0ACC1RLB6_9APHY|nr:hypothetical protein NM688_g9309 [Phlebia brevispora]